MQEQEQPRAPVVEVHCVFDRAVDPATERAIRDSLHTFFERQAGYAMDIEGAVGGAPGTDATISYTSAWASNAQASAAAESAAAWRDRNAGRFGWATCDIRCIPEHED